MGGLLALDEPIEIVALGGRAASAMSRRLTHVTEPPHPPTNLGWMLVGLPWAAARARVDLIHAPAYTAPFWAGVPVVLTVHDISYERHPQWFPYRRDRIRRWFYRQSARSASHVITDSKFSAAEIAAAYGIPSSRLTVVPLGVDGAHFNHDDGGSDGEMPPGVRAPFLLHVGDLHERRNLGVVVEAMAIARREGLIRPELSLVLAGVDRGVGASISEIASRVGLGDMVVRTGPVTEPQLRMLYRQATALVYPSLYEGFGLPLIEAMASGTPVIGSRSSSITEVLDDAGVLLDPLDAGAWAEAIVRVVDDEDARARMRAAGRRRAAGFTWERTARETLTVYRRAVRRL